MATYIVVTLNNDTVRAGMNNIQSAELIGSQTTFMCWHLTNPSSGDLSTAEGLTDYKGIVQIS